MIIALDAGHGGDNIGALDGLENNLNLDVALVASRVIVGSHVKMTRTEETTVGWDERKAICDTADLVISIHHNASANGNATGTDLFYYPGNETTHEACVGAWYYTPTALCGGTVIAPEHKEYPSARALVARYKPPTILIECCYLTNEADLAFTRSPTYYNRMGLFIANLVLCYKDATNG